MSQDIDIELFELCKEVYEKTGWEDTLAVYEQTAGIPEGEPYIAYPELERKWGLWGAQELKKQTPLYTSDYILDKLPRYRRSYGYLDLHPQPNDIEWEACYSHYHSYSISDTPLKALLKLTIALHEAGELS